MRATTKTKTVTIHLMEASMRFTDTDAEVKADFKYILDQEPDMVLLTEMGSLHKQLSQVCNGTDYRPVYFANQAEIAFIVKVGDKQIGIKDKGTVQASPGDASNKEAGHPGEGGYPDKYICWVKCKFYGEDVYYHGAHWIAHLADFNSDQRVKRSNMMSQQMAIQVRKHGSGSALSLFAGDTNQDDVPGEDKKLGDINSIFRRADLLTIWDEMEVYPPTFSGRTIDVIGSFTPDGRVKAKRYKVHPKQNSDHRFISAWYEITQKKSTGGGNSGGGNAGGGSDNGPKDPDFYATGGNVDWSDYADGSIYDLPQATDDSDGSNH